MKPEQVPGSPIPHPAGCLIPSAYRKGSRRKADYFSRTGTAVQPQILKLEFRPLSTAAVEKYLIEKYDVVDYRARTSAIFAQGNLGKAIRYIEFFLLLLQCQKH